MDKYNYSFNILFNKEKEICMLIIFETGFKSENVFYDVKDNSLILIYGKKNIVFENIDDKNIEIIKTAKNIIVSEMDYLDGFSNGQIIKSYEIKKSAIM